jgi:DNA-binding beta-propeller fold protein YncE
MAWQRGPAEDPDAGVALKGRGGNGMRRAPWPVWLTVVAVLTVMGTGCARQREAGPVGPVFYPPPPDAPRLQYLTTVKTADPWIQKKSSFAEFIVGTEETGSEGEIKSPYGVALHDGKLYVCDLGRFRVHVIDFAHNRYGVLGTSDQVVKPVGITVTPDGTKYVCDAGRRGIAVFDAQDRFVRRLGKAEECGPIDVAIYEDELFVADSPGAEIEVWDLQGKVKRTISGRGEGPHQLRRPAGVAIGPNGHLYVSDMELATVKEFDRTGKYVRSIGAPGDRPGFFARPKGVAVDPAGRIYVADTQWDKIQIFSPEGQLLLFFGESTHLPHGMITPTGVAIDATSVPAFAGNVDPEFTAEYLLVVTNQFGANKVVVHAFGHSQSGPPPADMSVSPKAAAPSAENDAENAPGNSRE